MQRAFFENFVAFSVSLICEVEISWALLGVFYAVVGPLGRDWVGELVAKESLVRLVGGGALMGKKCGRTAPLQTKVFDSTMGFPGEDVAVQPLC